MAQRARQHRPRHWRPPAARKRENDKRRGSAASRGYDASWARYSRQYRAQYPLCRRHNELFGEIVAANVTDHIERHDGKDDPMFWAAVNHQPLCFTCHNIKSMLELRGVSFSADHPYPDESYGDRPPRL